MKCLTCRWWAGEEDVMDRCYGVLPIIPNDGIYGEWPLTDENARCPRYRRHWRKTVKEWCYAICRWWYNRGGRE